MDHRSNLFSKRYDSYIVAHLKAKFLCLIDDTANKCYQNALRLVALDQIYSFLCSRCRAKNNCHTRNITCYKRYTHLSDNGVCQMSVARFTIWFRTIQIFQCFDKLST